MAPAFFALGLSRKSSIALLKNHLELRPRDVFICVFQGTGQELVIREGGNRRPQSAFRKSIFGNTRFDPDRLPFFDICLKPILQFLRT
jgi:hypothetical protein